MADNKLKLIGAVGVKVRPDASGFRGETQRALTKELSGLSKNVKVNADVGIDSRKAEAEIKDLKRQISALSQGVRLNLQTKGLEDLKRYNDALSDYKEKAEAAAKASDRYFGANKNHEERVKADEAALAARKKLLEASKDFASSWNDLNVKPLDLKIVNANQIDEQLRHVHRNFKAMKDDADDLANHIENLDPKMDIDLAGTEVAAARLAYASRPRTVPFIVTINQKSLAIAEGMLKSLSGLNVIESAGRHLERLLINFDKATVKGSIMAAVIGNIANSLTWLGTSAFSVAGGMADVVGLLAMVPASASALASVVTINVAAWKNFKGAIDGNKEAMEALPPAAQAAAKALQGTWTQIQKPVQKTFWDGMGESIQDAVEHVLPALRDGLTRTSEHAGRFAAGVLNSFTKIAQTGQFEEMFDGLEAFFDNLAGAAEPFFDAFNTLGVRGSHYMGQLGQSIADAAQRFDDWIQEAEQADKITVWIENGVKAFQDMWSVMHSTIDMFQAITRAADDAGATGLDGFARRMKEVADVMNGEPFQSRLSTIFEGARQGATNLNVGIKDMGRTFGESAEAVSYMLELLGSIGGESLSGVAKAMNQQSFQGGLISGLQGMRDLIRDLGPGFDSLANIVGNFARIAGSVLSNVGKPLSSILGVFEGITDIVADDLAAAVPALTGTLGTFVNLLAGPLEAGAHILEGILKVFNSLPGGIQQVVVGLGVLIAMRSSLSAMFSNMNGSAKTAFSGLMGYTRQADGSLKNMHGQTVRVGDALSHLGQSGAGSFGFLRAAWQEQTRMVTSGNDAIRKYALSVQNVGVGNAAIGRLSAAFTGLQQAGQKLNLQPSMKNLQGLGTAALGAAGHIGTAAGLGLRGAASGLMGVMGGPWGVALMAGVVALSAFAQANAKAKERTDALKQSLDQQSGAITDATKGEAIKQITRDYEGFEGVMRKVFKSQPDAKEWADTIAETGVSLGDAAEMAVKGGPAYDAYMAKLEDMTSGTGTVNTHLLEFKDRLKEVHDNTEAQKEAVKVYAEALGTTGPAAQRMAGAMDVIRDSASSARDKVAAMNTAIEILAGKGSVTARDAEFNAVKVLDASLDMAEGIRDGIAQSEVALTTADGLLNKLHPQAGALRDGMQSAADSIKESAFAAYQAAVDDGETAASAAEKANKIIAEGDEWLQQYADKAGVNVENLKGEWGTFFGTTWEMKAHFSGTTDQMAAAKKAAEEMGVEFDGETFMAWLLAQNDPTAVSVDEAAEWMRKHERAKPMAHLLADNEDASAKLQAAFTDSDAWDKAVFEAFINLDIDQAAAAKEKLFADLYEIIKANPTVMVDMDKEIFEDRKEQILLDLERLRKEEATPEVKARIEDLESQLNKADLILKDFAARETATNLTGSKTGFDEIMAAAKAEGAVFETSTFTSWLDANKDEFDGKEMSAEELGRLFASYVFESKLDANPSAFNGKKAGTEQEGRNFATNTFEAKLSATNSPFAGSRSAAAGMGAAFATWWYYANLGASNATGDGIAKADEYLLTNWVGKTYNAKLGTTLEAANGAYLPAVYANGGINRMVKSFASGGTENHIAQISRGQTPYRVWSEPETGGEAYIPLAAAKRKRSTQILNQVATHFGLNLVPASDVATYANGGTNGLTPADRTGSGVNVNIGSYVAQNSDTPDDVARALMRRVKAQGAYSPLEGF